MKGRSHYEPRHCKHCGQWMDEKLMEQRRQHHRDSVRESLQIAKVHGKQVGRPKYAGYEFIRVMRKNGMTLREIARALSVSLATVQRALKGNP